MQLYSKLRKYCEKGDRSKRSYWAFSSCKFIEIILHVIGTEASTSPCHTRCSIKPTSGRSVQTAWRRAIAECCRMSMSLICSMLRNVVACSAWEITRRRYHPIIQECICILLPIEIGPIISMYHLSHPSIADVSSSSSSQHFYYEMAQCFLSTDIVPVINNAL